MYLDLPQGKSNMFIEPQLGSFRPKYVEPGLQGFNGLGSGLGSIQSSAAQILNSANNMITPLPGPVVAAINQLPITSAQKSQLKKSPVSFFIVFADASQDKVIEFIKRTQAMSKKSRNYRISNRTVVVNPKKSDAPAYLAAQFLTVANQNPIEAARVAFEMSVEIGGAVLSSTGAAISQGTQDIAKGVSTAAQNAANEPRKAADAARKAAEDIAKGVTTGIQNMWPFGEYSALGVVDGGVVTGPAAAAAGGGAAAAVTMGEITALVTAAVGLAGLIVPALMSIVQGTPINSPTATDKQLAVNSSLPGGAMDKTKDSLPDEIRKSLYSGGKILGIPKNIALYGGLATGAGVFLYVLFKK